MYRHSLAATATPGTTNPYFCWSLVRRNRRARCEVGCSFQRQKQSAHDSVMPFPKFELVERRKLPGANSDLSAGVRTGWRAFRFNRVKSGDGPLNRVDMDDKHAGRNGICDDVGGKPLVFESTSSTMRAYQAAYHPALAACDQAPDIRVWEWLIKNLSWLIDHSASQTLRTRSFS
jgi:hypothetical protein